MDYKKYCEEQYLAEPPETNVPVVYLPCSHKSYKSKVINRAALTHEQHTALLATPKGFTWDQSSGLAIPPKKASPEDGEENGEAKNLVRCTDQRFLNGFTSGIWNTMTPKYRRKLEKILMKEFNLSKKQAKEFMKEQKLRSAFCQRRVQSRVNLSERHDWVKEIADTLADKITCYVAEMLSARRTRKVQIMANAILEGFGDLTGERCELDKPKNGIQKAQAFAADRLAVWLSRILGDYEEELCRDVIDIPDSASSDDEEPPKKKKEQEDEDEKEDEKAKSDASQPQEPKSDEPEPETKQPEKSKQKKPKPQKSKPDETKPEESNSKEDKHPEPE